MALDLRPPQMRVAYRAEYADCIQTSLGVQQLFISGLRMHAHFMDCTPKIAIEDKTSTFPANNVEGLGDSFLGHAYCHVGALVGQLIPIMPA